MLNLSHDFLVAILGINDIQNMLLKVINKIPGDCERKLADTNDIHNY
jgi:hypothetical protein